MKNKYDHQRDIVSKRSNLLEDRRIANRNNEQAVFLRRRCVESGHIDGSNDWEAGLIDLSRLEGYRDEIHETEHGTRLFNLAGSLKNAATAAEFEEIVDQLATEQAAGVAGRLRGDPLFPAVPAGFSRMLRNHVQGSAGGTRNIDGFIRPEGFLNAYHRDFAKTMVQKVCAALDRGDE